MGNIIRLRRDPHQEVQLLLPWYVTGRLDSADQALVEAHLAQCPTCQADLAHERRLETEVASLPVEADQAWASMVRRMEAGVSPRNSRWSWLEGLRRRSAVVWRVGGPWLGWALAAQVVLVVLIARPPQPQPQARLYHALSAPPAHAPGNIVVIFRPTAQEAAIRRALKSSGSRLVDGPTAADAYVLRAPDADRSAAVAKLRADRDVVLAEPIDAGEPP
jgi:anti-sigma factor RsiW